MTGRPLFAVVLAALLVTAGCIGNESVDAGPNATDGDPAVTDTTSTTPVPTTATTPDPTATATAATTTTATETTATTATTATTTNAPTGVEPLPGDVPAAVRDHPVRLREAGSFTSVWRYERTNGSTRSSGVYRFRVDFEADRYRLNVSLTDPRVAIDRYTEGDSTYERSYFGDAGPRYSRPAEPVNVTAATGVGWLAPLGDVDLRRNGTGTFRGEEMRRFTARGVDAYHHPTPEGFEALTEFGMTLLVDDRGIVRRIGFTMAGRKDDGGTVRISYAIVYVDIGNTDVREPDWIDEAKSEAGDE